MSSAKSISHSFARPITQCPYCDHVSPPGSKFCGECGAALHLLPCPHCGAVNDITQKTACYRCHGELREGAGAALNTLPAPTSSETQIESVSRPPNVARDVIGEVIAEPPVGQRPHWLVVGIVLMAFVAAGYFAYRQRSLLDVPEPARVAAPPRECRYQNGQQRRRKIRYQCHPWSHRQDATRKYSRCVAGCNGSIEERRRRQWHHRAGRRIDPNKTGR